MQISYFGLTSFKISSKDKVSILDPFDKASGLTPPRGAADLIFLSEKNNPLYSYVQSISGNPFIIDGPGEYNVKDHTVTGIPVKNKNGGAVTIYLIEAEGLKILHLAHINSFDLTQDQLEDLGGIDIALTPIGAEQVMDYDAAAKTMNLLEPKIVIPSHYKIEGLKVPAQNEEKFLKQMGKAERMEKLSVKKRDLAENGMKVVILEPMR